MVTISMSCRTHTASTIVHERAGVWRVKSMSELKAVRFLYYFTQSVTDLQATENGIMEMEIQIFLHAVCSLTRRLKH